MQRSNRNIMFREFIFTFSYRVRFIEFKIKISVYNEALNTPTSYIIAFWIFNFFFYNIFGLFSVRCSTRNNYHVIEFSYKVVNSRLFFNKQRVIKTNG